MPEEDGFSLITKVRDLPPNQGGKTPALALTAFAGNKTRNRVISAGFQTYLTKPVDTDELTQVIIQLDPLNST
jgi:CheY-like chemotaxis protein